MSGDYADFVATVCGMFGPLGVDSVNSANEVLSPVVCLNKCTADTCEPESVKDKTTTGVECKITATLEKEKCNIVHYEVGYVTAGCSALEYDLAHKALTTLCGCVSGAITPSFEEDCHSSLKCVSES